jgi:hypothetical protein
MTLETIKNRPEIPSLKITDGMSPEERFQNETLRPIIKMQHDLLIAHYQYYLVLKKCLLHELSEVKRIDFIDASFQRDIQFRKAITGMIIGHFTLDEYSLYQHIYNETNKRIIQIIKERILNSMNELLKA